MLTTCLFCHAPFPGNGTVEWFPVAGRVAYDPGRGRLWAVCPSCARWTLAPFEERWEALEELERLVRDRARLLAETENIGLLAVDDIEIVRVGEAGLREESWWRFGKELAGRRRRARKAVLRGKILDAALIMLISGIPFWGLSDPDHWIARARNREFGKRLVGPGSLSPCDVCGREPDAVPFRDFAELRLRAGPDGGPALSIPCWRCQEEDAGGRHHLRGVPAEHVLRRTLAYRNFAGGTEQLVEDAVGLVESYESTAELLRRTAERQLGLGALTEKGSFALEIALSHDTERRLLEMDLAELEARWRQEEEIAAIADRL